MIKCFPKNTIKCFDFVAKEKTDIFINEYFYKNKKVLSVKNIEDVFKNSDLIIIHNNNQKIYKLNFNNLLKLSKKNLLIYDFWEMFEKNFFSKFNRNIIYKSLGGHSG